MKDAKQLKVDDYGFTVTLTVKEWDKDTSTYVVVDISAATTKNILLRQPDGTVVSNPATFVAGGTDGKLRYTVPAGQLSQAGKVQWLAEIVTPTWGQQTSAIERKVFPKWAAAA